MCLLIEEMGSQELLQVVKQGICRMDPLQRGLPLLVELVTILILLQIEDQEPCQTLPLSQLELKTDSDPL